MKNDLTELVFILDKSGSMTGLESDTIGGFNSMLEKQRKLPGECRITTVLFDHRYTLLHDRIDIQAVRPITDKEYFVEGSTALLDAMGHTIQKLAAVQKNTAEDYRAGKVMFVIITDGYENASREYTAEQVKALVERQKAEADWEFIFLGANIDAVSTAQHYGISADKSVDYLADKAGTRLSYDTLCDVAREYRASGKVPAAKLERISSDTKKRGKKP